MSNENKQHAGVRVCAISDAECSRGCGAGACKKEAVAPNGDSEIEKNGRTIAFLREQNQRLIEAAENLRQGHLERIAELARDRDSWRALAESAKRDLAARATQQATTGESSYLLSAKVMASEWWEKCGFEADTVQVQRLEWFCEFVRDHDAYRKWQATTGDERTALTEAQSAAIDAVCAKLTPRQAVELGDHIQSLRTIQWKANLPIEPRNVQGMTRAEFEQHLRVGYQHDNVRAQERGIGPKWDGPVGLTEQDEREIAERVERNYPVKGTFTCPICGKAEPHEHTGEEIVGHRNAQKHATTPSPVAGSAGQAPVALSQVAELETAICNNQNSEALRLLHHIRNAIAAPSLTQGSAVQAPSTSHLVQVDPNAAPLTLAAPSLTTDAGAVLTDEQREAVEYAQQVLRQVEAGDGTFVGQCADAISGLDSLLAAHPTEQRMIDAGREEQPSWTNPMTPYGMLVRALRIVVGTTLMDMATFLGCGPAQLSALEFGRKPVTNADIVNAAHYFASFGINSTTHALTMAARKAEIERQGGEA